MKKWELEALIDGMAPAISEAIDERLAPLAERIRVLEAAPKESKGA